MTKEKTQILKGIAILFMIFFHLFNRMQFVDLCTPLIYIDGIPLVHFLTEYTNPVALFLILGGYGLYKSNLKGDKNRWNRLLKLLIHFWVILITFVIIGHFVKPDKYPGSSLTLLLNLSTFESSYNGELWFLFPYIIVSIGASLLYKLINRVPWLYIVIGTLLIHMGSIYFITRVTPLVPSVEAYLNTLIHIPLFLFNFCMGMIAAKYNWIEGIQSKLSKIGIKLQVLIILGFIGLLMAFSHFFPYNFFFGFFLLSALALLPYSKWATTTLVKLGNQSMNMWMIHSWFCYHLFSNFIYSFKYPIIIFIILCLISYGLSLLFNKTVTPLESLFLTKKEIKERPIL
ncbi:MAG: acyltransferase [Muribaculaceae bacterium]|nr:acyltransferase [Muribaculaceae bacterium]